MEKIRTRVFKTLVLASVAFLSLAFLSVAEAGEKPSPTHLHCKGGSDGADYTLEAMLNARLEVVAMSFEYHDNDGFAFGRVLKSFTSAISVGKSLDFSGTDDAGTVVVHALATGQSTGDAGYAGDVSASGSSGESLEVDVTCSLD